MSRGAGVLAVLALAPAAWAAEGAPTSAERLFEQGLADMLAGRYDTGCPALAESFRLDPLPGALFTLAECEKGQGKIASALAHYRDFLARFESMAPDAQQRQRDRQAVASQAVDDLERRVPRLRLRVPDVWPRGAVVRLDGRVVPAGQLGAFIEVDPGRHVVVIERDEGEPSRREVSLAETEERVIDLEVEERAGADGGAFTIAGWALLGLGGAGVLVGAITGGVTMGHASTIEGHCIDLLCDQEGLDAARAAEVTGAVSTASFVIGAAALATGGVLLVLGADGDDAVGLAAGPRSAQLSWRVRW